ncbi:unnamed protein product [Rhodiola kirilowii]
MELHIRLLLLLSPAPNFSDEAMPTQSGLALTNTESIRSFIVTAFGDANLSEDLQQEASRLSSQPSVSYKSIREIWSTSSSSMARPDLAQLFDGSVLVFNSPQPGKRVRN